MKILSIEEFVQYQKSKREKQILQNITHLIVQFCTHEISLSQYSCWAEKK